MGKKATTAAVKTQHGVYQHSRMKLQVNLCDSGHVGSATQNGSKNSALRATEVIDMLGEISADGKGETNQDSAYPIIQNGGGILFTIGQFSHTSMHPIFYHRLKSSRRTSNIHCISLLFPGPTKLGEPKPHTIYRGRQEHLNFAPVRPQ